ncbi:hypothetical protein [Mesorhizobium sp. B2-8-9]|uniref:hypothetical protein n=1 Tax=Mesorhizobium sp. B2-8-9 TaxID=2589899 RepID=UPI0011281593|nr:hypothetical protein [Mesorhizobium sp. B2-8-9]TPI78499.1 hypothetical protein FJ423_16440 [Mesorhizobium sp. B2-8-9]
MSEDTSEARASRHYDITLIHGTWGRGIFPSDHASKLRWFEEGSPFWNKLVGELQVAGLEHTVSAFKWSGDNSIVQRNIAAGKLADYLNQRRMALPESTSLCIAHSHGGNVALRAFHILASPQNDNLLVALSVPFLSVKLSTNKTIDIIYLLVAFTIVALFFNVVYFSIGNLERAFDVDLPLYKGDSFFLEVAISGVTLIPAALAMFFLSRYFVQHLFSYTKSGDVLDDRVQRLVDASHYDLTSGQSTRMLIIRGEDDEADGVLKIGGFGIYLANKIVSAYIVTPIYFSVFVADVYFVLHDLSEKGVIGDMYFKATRGIWLWTIYLMGAYLVLMLSTLILRSFFGRELILGSSRCEVSAGSTPDFHDGVSVLTLAKSDWGGLRHSIYEHPRCVSAVVTWLATSRYSDRCTR